MTVGHSWLYRFMACTMKTSNLKKIVGLHVFVILLITPQANCDRTQLEKCLKRSETFSEIVTYLTVRLTNEIDEKENFVISPLSISSALAMLYIGAGGDTKTQISDALHYNVSNNKCPDTKIVEGFKDLFLSLEEHDDIISIMVANVIFIQTGFRISPAYMFKIKQYFDSEIKHENFAHEEVKTLNNINKWISEKTNSQIKKLINEPLDTMTVMVLANVIYFQGLWVHPFTNSWNSYFHLVDKTTKIVPFMKIEEKFNFYHDFNINYSFLELPYKGGNISMLLVLSRHIHEIPKFNITSESLCNIRSKFENITVMVGLPKVNLSYSRELSKDMSTFGMTDIFTDKADLTEMSEQNDLHVSIMIHKAIIEIDEKGSKASGVSGIGIDVRRRPVHEATFWANHPFLFYIIDKNRETILFAGRVTDP